MRFLFIPLVIVLFFALSGVVWYLWNAVLPDIIHVGILSYWDAACILLLCRILFGSFKFGGRDGRGMFGGSHKHMREKWATMTDEDRVKFKQAFRERGRRSHDHNS